MLGFDKGLAASGLFGYNALLVGLALATFDSTQDYTAATLIAAIGIACFSSILFVMMGKLLFPYKSPPLTLPFNVATTWFLLSTAHMGRLDYGPVRPPSLPDHEAASNGDFNITVSQLFAGTIRGLGQVFLADHLAAGFLVLLGMVACSRISAAAAWMGSALGAALAVATGVPAQAIETGLYGFNPSLSATAMFMFYSPSFGAGILAAFAGAMTLVAQQALATVLEPWGLPFMTLPFCVASLPFIIIQGTTSLVVAVPLASMTVPEDHLRVVRMRIDGFAILEEALMGPNPNSRLSSKMRSRKLSKSLSLLSTALDEAEESPGGSKFIKPRTSATKASEHKRPWKDDKSLQMTKEAAIDIYQALQNGLPVDCDDKFMGEISLSHITDGFQAAGLKDAEALNLATLILSFIDQDNSYIK